MPPVGFEPTISASEWPRTDALDRAVTYTGISCLTINTEFVISNSWQLIIKLRKFVRTWPKRKRFRRKELRKSVQNQYDNNLKRVPSSTVLTTTQYMQYYRVLLVRLFPRAELSRAWHAARKRNGACE
jgi:hypothetical protein